MSLGRSLELFFIDGTPDGMLTAEVFGWTGHILKVPRLRLKDGLRRSEAQNTGIYILLGYEATQDIAYIGEAESIAKRIRDHDAKLDWLSTAIFITTSSDALHKAHVRYLEARLIKLANEAQACDLRNGNQPEGSSLNEAAQANMKAFLETLLMVLPALGIGIFQSGKRDLPLAETSTTTQKDRFILEAEKHGVLGHAELSGSDFIVLKGSKARLEWLSQSGHSYKRLFNRLVGDGVFISEDKTAVFNESYAFNSPSAAASVLLGRSSNGRVEWRLESDNRSYAQWEQDQLAEEPL